MDIGDIVAISFMVFMPLFIVGLLSGFFEKMYMFLFHKPIRPLVKETIRSLVHNSNEWKPSIMGMKHKSGIDVWVSIVGWEYYHFHVPSIHYDELTKYEKWKLSRACKDWEKITGLKGQKVEKEVSAFVEGYERLKK